MAGYREFFQEIAGHEAFPYQERLGNEEWPDVLDVPTGLGKTAAIVVAWLWKILTADDGSTPRRLAYCLPMRVLVEQTTDSAGEWVERARKRFESRSLAVPRVEVLMGGSVPDDWRRQPESPAILVGTQDMLLSRALMRGYGMSRYGWQVDFALLHNDCFWVFDEVQLMGPAVATSAQLEAFRRQWRTGKPGRSLWASATLRPDWLHTVDFAREAPDLGALRIGDEDRRRAGRRLNAVKRLRRSAVSLSGLTARDIASYAEALAGEVLGAHRGGTQTIVVVNRVDRAQAIYERIDQRAEGTGAEVLLLHSRFRPPERRAIEARVRGSAIPEGGRIVVSTQAIEAGVDISSAALFTELAPWSSLVQRFGRCNRYGEIEGGADVVWVDVTLGGTDAAPYTEAELAHAREVLETAPGDAAPASLPSVTQDRPFGQVLRRRDMLELFNTDPDLQGFEIDIAPFIRDQGPPQVQVFWREVPDGPEDEEPEPHREELCSVSMGQIGAYLKRKVKGKPTSAWRWMPLPSGDRGAGRWSRVNGSTPILPGTVLMLHAGYGGYDTRLGFEPSLRSPVVVIPPSVDPEPPPSMVGDEREARTPRWVRLEDHLDDVAAEIPPLAAALDVDAEDARSLLAAARWHDIGKAHPAFVTAMNDVGPPGSDGGFWAKSPSRSVLRCRIEREDGTTESRRYFRHELASMLAWLSHNEGHPRRDLIAYLVAAHHGKVRTGLRAMPGENEPRDGRPFARGVWDGDVLPTVAVDGRTIPATLLSLSLMRMGDGPAGPSWLERTSGLLADLGPFRLSWLEALLRIADWRASSRGEEPR